ncbi:monocarboxylate transporter [Colletotrichum tofieldiae]|uniref:Monocarboxylate transporter n=1 Tax=Colletotrichum tofieldiae TaxID=708197 RepID=A0A166Y5I1_9PEZI|nr:monocarboxylate transporter [Colletotrichum tofieldiae]
MATLPTPSTSITREALMRHGINSKIAQQVAYVELNQWSPTIVDNILQKIRRPHISYYPLGNTGPDPDETFIRRHLSAWLPLAWVRPPLETVRQSVGENKALCVNRRFQWKLCSSGYFAVSHVWGEGIRADFKGRGLTREHLTRIFDALAITGAEWIWLDVLAVPNADPAGQNLSPEEKTLQVQVINTLPQVYEGATAVIVFDALVLQMHDASPVDVAVGLVCGAWISRVWTYQEIRLAKKAVIVTADRTYTWNGIVAALRELVDNDESRQGGPPRLSKFYSLFLSMAILQYVGEIGLSLTDVSFASATRQSTYDIDYARSLFALVNLPWDPNWTTSSPGMQAIYQNRRQDAARLVAMYGVKRLNVSPRWAPSRLAGLEGVVHGDMIWEDKGLRGTWHKERIVRFTELKSGTGRQAMRFLLSDRSSGLWCEVFVGADEEPETIEAFNKAVVEGRAFLICKHQIADGIGFDRGTASQALVVETIGNDRHDEVDVLFATALRAVKGESRSERRSMLLRH